MKRKNRVTHWQGIAQMETVREDRPKNETLKSFTAKENARIAAEQAAKDTAEEQRILAPLREEARKASRRIALYWRQPLSEILTNGMSLCPVDPIGDYPVTSEKCTQAEFDAVQQRFVASLTTRGTTILPDALVRSKYFLYALKIHRGIDLQNEKSHDLAFQRLFELGCFGDEVQNYELPTPAPTMRPEATPVNPLDELESLSLESREGSRRGREIVDELVGVEERSVWNDFLDRTHQEIGRPLTPTEGLAIFNLMKHRGLSFRNQGHLRMAVVALCHSGELPQDLLSEQDRLNAFIESADLQDFSVKQEINRRQRQIDEQTELKRLGLARAITRAALDSVR